ncbi:phosphoethanolamine transferase [Gabonibacter chumensis]|uniref:phosphoethanolamine transferase n=1 Tax=Gabonibacter chumensis TaxID=2972474 RepID=UPI0025743DB9|nr:phosphoethanolamine transferase [Gabonibacter chumensis]MCR9011335.1 phosphoethanolamine transferase [Gabonibacter chumensis]
MKRFGFAWKPIGGIFVRNFYFIVVLLLFNFSTGAWMNAEREIGISIYTKWVHGFINAFLVCYLLGAFREFISSVWLKRVYTGVVIFLSGLLFVCECFTLYYYKSGFVPSIVLPLLATNPEEANEFFQMYGGVKWLAGGSIVLVMACWISTFSLKRISSRTLFRIGKFVALFLLAGILAMIYRQNKTPLFKTMVPIQRLWVSQRMVRDEMKVCNKLMKQVSSDPVITRNEPDIEDIVLILGESLGRKYMGVYDSIYPTTPLLRKLKERGEIYLYQDVISPYVSTILCIQSLFSFYHYESVKAWNKYDLLVDVMKKAGYETLWISNQESFGAYGNLPAVIAKRSDVTIFNHTRSSFEHCYGDFDEELLPIIDDQLQKNPNRNFWVIHLMGSHGNYQHRYPEEYARFKADDVTWLEEEEKKEVLASYLNTILYNDHVVYEILERFRERKAVIVYLSDHGEELFERRDFSGHTETDPSRYMVEIPFLIWCSPLYKEMESQKVGQIAASVKRPYMTDDLIHTILDLANIGTTDFDSTRSVVNPAFNSKRKRIVSRIDYDRLRAVRE